MIFLLYIIFIYIYLDDFALIVIESVFGSHLLYYCASVSNNKISHQNLRMVRDKDKEHCMKTNLEEWKKTKKDRKIVSQSKIK